MKPVGHRQTHKEKVICPACKLPALGTGGKAAQQGRLYTTYKTKQGYVCYECAKQVFKAI